MDCKYCGKILKTPLDFAGEEKDFDKCLLIRKDGEEFAVCEDCVASNRLFGWFSKQKKI